MWVTCSLGTTSGTASKPRSSSTRRAWSGPTPAAVARHRDGRIAHVHQGPHEGRSTSGTRTAARPTPSTQVACRNTTPLRPAPARTTAAPKRMRKPTGSSNTPHVNTPRQNTASGAVRDQRSVSVHSPRRPGAQLARRQRGRSPCPTQQPQANDRPVTRHGRRPTNSSTRCPTAGTSPRSSPTTCY
jgi:hypothetical protein